MRPPTWALDRSTRLTATGFTRSFTELVGRLDSFFFKLETWQTYQEPDTASLRAFEADRTDEVEPLIRAEADAELDAYTTFHRKGVAFTRLRLIQMPPTRYMRWELHNYAVRARPPYGENVRLIDVTDSVDRLPNDQYFDFLLFDGSAALVHDYGDDGLQDGGWLVRDPIVVAELTRRARQLEARSSPLDGFLLRHAMTPELQVARGG